MRSFLAQLEIRKLEGHYKFGCPYCIRTYAKRNSLNYHLKNIHADELRKNDMLKNYYENLKTEEIPIEKIPCDEISNNN